MSSVFALVALALLSFASAEDVADYTLSMVCKNINSIDVCTPTVCRRLQQAMLLTGLPCCEEREINASQCHRDMMRHTDFSVKDVANRFYLACEVALDAQCQLTDVKVTVKRSMNTLSEQLVGSINTLFAQVNSSQALVMAAIRERQWPGLLHQLMDFAPLLATFFAGSCLRSLKFTGFGRDMAWKLICLVGGLLSYAVAWARKPRVVDAPEPIAGAPGPMPTAPQVQFAPQEPTETAAERRQRTVDRIVTRARAIGGLNKQTR